MAPLPGFEPGFLAPQAKVISKLHYRGVSIPISLGLRIYGHYCPMTTHWMPALPDAVAPVPSVTVQV